MPGQSPHGGMSLPLSVSPGFGRGFRVRVPSPSRRPHGGRSHGHHGAYGMKSKLAVSAITIIMLHLIGINVLFPWFTNHAIGSDTEAATTANASPGSSDGGGIMRLLSETASALTTGKGDLGLTSEQAALLARYSDKTGRGRDVWIKRDGLTNPFALPPTDVGSASNPENVQRYKARTLNSLYREKCGNETVLPYNGGTGREWTTSSRAWTRAYGSQVSKYRWCRGGAFSEVPELKQVLMLHSTKPRPARAVTVVTQLSLERSAMLEQQCSLWPHPIAAVVYIPLVRGRIFSGEEDGWNMAPLERGIDAMTALHERLSAMPGACILDMEVVAEERCNKDLASMYPTNAVRNRALHLTSTDVVLLLDADFVVDLSLVKALEDRARYEELVDMLSRHRALVLPAFEAWDQGEWGRKVALEAVHKGKAYIAAKFMYNVVIGFHMSHYPQGHEKTNFWRWINTTEAYEVDYTIGFEPYIMMLRKFVPYYDERFRGYYWNKVQHLMHVSMQNAFTFVVHPSAFVVHVPHRKPTTKVRTRRSGQKERNHVMFLEALEDMKHDRFVPVTGFPHLCLPTPMQTAGARVVDNEEQKTAMLSMSTRVAKLPEGEPKGGGAEALARARGQRPKPRGELPFSQDRPVVASAAQSRAKARQEEALLAAEELRQDLKEFAEAEAEAAQFAAMPQEDLDAELQALEVEEAHEKAALVQEVISKHHNSDGKLAKKSGGGPRQRFTEEDLEDVEVNDYDGEEDTEEEFGPQMEDDFDGGEEEEEEEGDDEFDSSSVAAVSRVRSNADAAAASRHRGEEAEQQRQQQPQRLRQQQQQQQQVQQRPQLVHSSMAAGDPRRPVSAAGAARNVRPRTAAQQQPRYVEAAEGDFGDEEEEQQRVAEEEGLVFEVQQQQHQQQQQQNQQQQQQSRQFGASQQLQQEQQRGRQGSLIGQEGGRPRLRTRPGQNMAASEE